ncbi:MAG: hypothetical protein KKI03_18590, partial [Gammaproteobacteria bacterium]|nr:hypothetical protein [Gammaproteobacteria bacterium]
LKLGYASACGRAPFTPKPGRIAQSPCLPPSKSKFLQQAAHIDSCRIQRKQLLTSPVSVPNRSQNQSGDALCEGKGGEREAGGGHVAKRIARLIHPPP